MFLINVLDPKYGVCGDGVTDDTDALVAIRNILANRGGGTMFFPPGSYHIGGFVELFDNMTVVGTNAIFLKLAASSRQASFVGKSNGASGYGTGARNVVFEGVTFKGSFLDDKGNGVVMHHVENVEFRNVTFEECVLAGHAADLGGCRKILFINCTFAGWKIRRGREYTEAIQCDYSTATTVGVDTDLASYDGLPTVDVRVEACQFISLPLHDTIYPAPNPIGSHSRVEGRPLEDIHFINNVVRGGHWTVGTMGAAMSLHRGWIHFGYSHGIKINGNKFVSMHSRPTMVININAPSTAYSLTSVRDPSAIPVPTIPLPVEDFECLDNEFIGFNSGETGSRSESLISLQGHSENSRAKNFKLHGTKFSDCSPFAEDHYGYEGQIGIDARYIENLSIQGTALDGLSQVIKSVKCKMVKISCLTGYLTSIFIQDDQSLNYILSDIDVRYPGGGQMLRTVDVRLTDVSLRTPSVPASGPLGDSLLSFYACSDIRSWRSTVDNSNHSASVSKGIFVYGSSQNGHFDHTFVHGIFSESGLHISTDSKSVTSANTSHCLHDNRYYFNDESRVSNANLFKSSNSGSR